LNKFFYSALFFLACLNTACDNCTAPDHIISINAIRISGPDTMDYTSQNAFSIPFFVYDSTESKKGKGKCHHKELAISFENQWNQDLFSLSCNRAFIFMKDTLPAFSNLLNTAVASQHIDLTATGDIDRTLSGITLRDFNPPSLIKTYTFYLEGTTTNHKTFKDSCNIFIR
jgi:hypothetical protein